MEEVLKKPTVTAIAIVNEPDSSLEHRTTLGDDDAVWRRGVVIGSDPRCDLVLTDVPPLAARVAAAGSSRVLIRLPTSAEWPLPPLEYPITGFDETVDYRPFQIGPYTVRLDFEGLSTAVTPADEIREAAVGLMFKGLPVLALGLLLTLGRWLTTMEGGSYEVSVGAIGTGAALIFGGLIQLVTGKDLVGRVIGTVSTKAILWLCFTVMVIASVYLLLAD